MKNLIWGLVLTSFFSAPASATPIRLTDARLPITQSQLGALGIKLVAPSLTATIAPTPSLTSVLATLQPLAQLKPAAAPVSPVVQIHEEARVLPALRHLADSAVPEEQGPDASAISRFYDSTSHAAPADVIALARDPDTGLYGVSRDQLKIIVTILRKHYGDSLLDLAAIGSRAKGKASSLKNFRPPTRHSDLDLAPLLRNSNGGGPDSFAIERVMQQAVGIPIQLHGVFSTGETSYTDDVPFYGGGYETHEYFRNGDAVRIPIGQGSTR